MLNFNAGSFSDLAETPLGKELWQFLTDKETWIRLETATYLQRPAIEGLQAQLLAKFGDAIKTDRCKQMAGKMVRQIMENQGYNLDQAGVRIRTGELFSSAARYRKSV